MTAKKLYLYSLMFLLIAGSACSRRNTSGAEQDNETWKDSKSGALWQRTPAGPTMKWDEAKRHCQSLSGWRLPSISELRSLIRGCAATELGHEGCRVEDGGCLDASCTCKDQRCPLDKGPAEGRYWPTELQGSGDFYWSSSAVADDGAWGVVFGRAAVIIFPVNSPGKVRCVRKAQ